VLRRFALWRSFKYFITLFALVASIITGGFHHHFDEHGHEDEIAHECPVCIIEHLQIASDIHDNHLSLPSPITIPMVFDDQKDPYASFKHTTGNSRAPPLRS